MARFTLATLERKARFSRQYATRNVVSLTSLARFADAPTALAIIAARNSDARIARAMHITRAAIYADPRPTLES